MRKVALFDLDGTIWHNGVPILSAVACVNTLKAAGVEVYFVTNNSTAKVIDFMERIHNIQIECQEADILTTGVATGLYCQKQGYQNVYIVGEEGLHLTLQEYGVEHTTINPEAVIVGLKRDVVYDELKEAMHFIMNGAHFIATNTDAQLPVSNGFLPGAGSVVAFVETAAQKKPDMIIGKPYRPILDAVYMRYQLSSDDLVVMIGDNYATDIYGGIEYGIETIHVAGGVHTTDYVMKQSKKPTLSVASLMDERVFQIFE